MPRCICAVVVALVTLSQVSAQRGGSDRHLELGVRAGILNYQGDLQEALFTTAGSQLALGGMVRYNLSDKLALRGVIEFGQLAASDADSPDLADRGFSFEADLLAGELTVEFLPLGRERFSNGIYLSQVNPYLFAGLGAARADATVTTTRPGDAALFPEANDQDFFLTAPLGGGVRWDIASGFCLGAEANWRATFSDYIDGVSVNGRPDREDWFWTATAYASFTFGSGGGMF